LAANWHGNVTEGQKGRQIKKYKSRHNSTNSSLHQIKYHLLFLEFKSFDCKNSPKKHRKPLLWNVTKLSYFRLLNYGANTY
jgi:hypothetical protein